MRAVGLTIGGILAMGCSLPLLLALILVGMLGAGAVAMGWSTLGADALTPGGYVLAPGREVLAGTPGFPAWAQPCGPEPGALATDPSACTGHPQPYPYGYEGFSTGQCTWYVATRRLVTWHTPGGLLGGNAGQWLGLAEAAGFSIGAAPEVGAIAVYTDSGPGHVAFVVGVSASGGYTVAESNWALAGPSPPYVDLRGVAPGATGSPAEALAGFIYGPGPAQRRPIPTVS